VCDSNCKHVPPPPTPPCTPADALPRSGSSWSSVSQAPFERKLSESEFREWFRQKAAQGALSPAAAVPPFSPLQPQSPPQQQQQQQQAPAVQQPQPPARPPAVRAANQQNGGQGLRSFLEGVFEFSRMLLKCLFAAFVLTYREEKGVDSVFIGTTGLFLFLYQMQQWDILRHFVVVRQAPPPPPPPPRREEAQANAGANADGTGPAAAPDAGDGGTEGLQGEPARPAEPPPPVGPPVRTRWWYARKLFIIFFESLAPSWTAEQLDRDGF